MADGSRRVTSLDPTYKRLTLVRDLLDGLSTRGHLPMYRLFTELSTDDGSGYGDALRSQLFGTAKTPTALEPYVNAFYRRVAATESSAWNDDISKKAWTTLWDTMVERQDKLVNKLGSFWKNYMQFHEWDAWRTGELARLEVQRQLKNGSDQPYLSF